MHRVQGRIVQISLGVLLLLPLACQAAEFDLVASHWRTYHAGHKTDLTNAPDGSLSFVFPDASQGTINYLYSHAAYDVSGATTVSAALALTVLSGTPAFTYPTAPNPCVYPATVRLLLFDTSGGWGDEFGRWWSHEGFQELIPGVFTLTAHLDDPTQWSSVYGTFASESPEALAGFAAVKAHAKLGMTFGGGCFFGHGVSTSGGTVEFDLHTFSAQ